MDATRIGVVGDFNPESPTHRATNEAIEHAGAALDTEARVSWLPTADIERETLESFDGLLCAPGSPYSSLEGALEAIRFAREFDRPFVGTCGGFQHAVLEYARNVLGVRDAHHAEYDPYASRLFVSALPCSLAGKRMKVRTLPGSSASELYARDEANEQYCCNFGLNSNYRDDLEHAGLMVSGIDHDGEMRIVEIRLHRFFLATLFVPRASSTPDDPHPLITGFIKAAREFHRKRRELQQSHARA